MICFSSAGISPSLTRSRDAWCGMIFSSRDNSVCHNLSWLSASATTSAEFLLICSLSYIRVKVGQLPFSMNNSNETSSYVFLKHGEFLVVHVPVASLTSLLCLADFEERLVHLYHASLTARFAIQRMLVNRESDRCLRDAYLVRSAISRRASSRASSRGTPPRVLPFSIFSSSPRRISYQRGRYDRKAKCRTYVSGRLVWS